MLVITRSPKDLINYFGASSVMGFQKTKFGWWVRWALSRFILDFWKCFIFAKPLTYLHVTLRFRQPFLDARKAENRAFLRVRVTRIVRGRRLRRRGEIKIERLHQTIADRHDREAHRDVVPHHQSLQRRQVFIHRARPTSPFMGSPKRLVVFFVGAVGGHRDVHVQIPLSPFRARL